MYRPLLVSLVALAAAGCLSGDLTPDLEDTRWALTGWTSPDKSDPVRFRVTIEFEDDRFGGKGPVNQYGGSFRQAEGANCSLSRPTATLRGGADDDMAAEQAYFGLLDRVRTCRREGGVLILADDTGRTLLVYSPLRE
jgi:heat shock protein HslJ